MSSDGLAAVAVRIREAATASPVSLASLLILFAVLLAVQRRSRPGNAVLDGRARTLEYRGGVVQLTHREADLLSFLLDHPDQFFTTEELVRGAWNAPDRSPEDVRVYVSRLRQKLAPLALPWRVASQQWRGYSLASPGGAGRVPVVKQNHSAPLSAPRRRTAAIRRKHADRA